MRHEGTESRASCLIRRGVRSKKGKPERPRGGRGRELAQLKGQRPGTGGGRERSGVGGHRSGRGLVADRVRKRVT